MGKDVSLWFARNENDEIVTIDNINKNDNKQYYCPLCGSELIPKQGNIMSWHFAHVDKTKCSIESAYHFWVKNELFKTGESFKVTTDSIHEYICKEIHIEETYKTQYKNYNPDLTIITECGERIFVEINHTNKKLFKKYIHTWIELNSIVVEIETKDIIDNNSDKLFKAVYFNGCVDKKDYDKLYQDTIGKYKKSIVNITLSKEQEKILKNLEWLWNELTSYNNEEISIEEIANSLLYLTPEEIKIINPIIENSTCTDVMRDIDKYHVNKLTLEVLDSIKDVEGFKFCDYSKPDNIEIIKSFTKNYKRIKLLSDYESVFCMVKNDVISYFSRKIDEYKIENLMESEAIKNFVSDYNELIKLKYINRFNICMSNSGYVDFRYESEFVEHLNLLNFYETFLYGTNESRSNILDTHFDYKYKLLSKKGRLNSFIDDIEYVNKTLIKLEKSIYIEVRIINTNNIECNIISEHSICSPFKFVIRTNTIRTTETYSYLYTPKFGKFRHSWKVVRENKNMIKIDEDFIFLKFLKETICNLHFPIVNKCGKCKSSVFKNIDEKWFFITKGFKQPCLCYDCRQKRKQKGGQ